MTPLFVSGCARSGTTALAKFLGALPDVLLGVERYGKLAHNSFKLSAEHLTLERFRDLSDGNADYDSFEGRYHWDENLAAKLSGEHPVRYIGDKKPRLYHFFSEAQEVFPHARHVFIYREPLAVARSWQRRADNKDGGWRRRDALAGVKEWNLALQKVQAATNAGLDVEVVNYERFLLQQQYQSLLDRLDIADSDAARAISNKLYRGYQRSQENNSDAQGGSWSVEREDKVRQLVDEKLLHWADSVALG